ncbi:hypothetical protein [Halobacterium sp. CBA1126]|nr:hypothetical protein [Halobacterium sp. CBA1126]
MADSPPAGSLEPSDDDSAVSGWRAAVWFILPFLLFVGLLVAAAFLAA